ncbi:MAG: hypothetical protein ACJ75G_02180 [Gaiellaceae bacterium]
MGLIEVVGQRRLERDLRRREAALQEAARELRRREAAEVAAVPEAAEPEPESVVAQHASRTRGPRECDFCGRRFQSYGQFLNHKCHAAD